MSKPKVAILHNIVAPYRFQLFNELAEDVDLTVLFLAEGSKNRKWDISLYTDQIKFKYKVLPHIRFVLPLKDYTEYIINPTIFWELRHFEFVITAGWLDFSCQVAYFLKKFYGYKLILWSESTANENSWQRSMTRPFVQKMVQAADSCIAIGTRSHEYLVSLGAQTEKVFIAISTVDVDYFLKESNISDQIKRSIKTTLGIPMSNKIVLYVGQFIPRKNVELLISALELLPHHFSLLLIGYGPQKESYEKYLSAHPDASLYILSHQEITSLPRYYGLADVFVLPSLEETWGLVVNEAAASGLPLLVSSKAGSSADLVRDGKNGFVFDPKNVSELVAGIEACTTNDKVQEKMSQCSQRLIQNYTPRAAAKSFYRAIKSAGRIQ